MNADIRPSIRLPERARAIADEITARGDLPDMNLCMMTAVIEELDMIHSVLRKNNLL